MLHYVKGIDPERVRHAPLFIEGEDGPGGMVLNSRSFSIIFLSLRRGTALNSSAALMTGLLRQRAFGRQELPSSPSPSLPKRL